MRIENEFDVSILERAEDLLDTDYGMNIRDDDFKGFIDSDNVYSMIENLCDKIEKLKKEKDIENDYPNEERDREREILGL